MQLPLACKFNIIWEIRVSKKKKVLLVTDNRAIPTKTETWLAFCPTVPLAFLTYQEADFTLSFVLHFCLADNTIISIINFFFFFFNGICLPDRESCFLFFFFTLLPFCPAVPSTKVLFSQPYSFYKHGLSPGVPLPSKNQHLSVTFTSQNKKNTKQYVDEVTNSGIR